MPPIVIDVRKVDDQRDIVHRAAEALTAGKVVAFPTETVYGIAASALNEEAVNRLAQLKGRRPGHPLALAIKSADDALDFIPDMTPLGRRLARRCWPGPVTLVLDNRHPESVVCQLPQAVQEAVSPNGTLGLRVPDHPLMISVLRICAGPLALTSANKTGEADAVSGQEVVEALGDSIDLVIDDGPSKLARPSSVVRVDRENKLSMLREGVVSEATVTRLAGPMILFVCTGNTCRSPMAEMLMRQRIAAKLGCALDEVEDHGLLIASAGIAAMTGGRSSPGALDVMKERGLDLSSHESQPLTDRLVKYADLILTMTHGHRDAILAQWPAASDRTKVLCHDHSDVSDPIGGPTEMYRRCAEQIEAQLDRWLEQIDLEDH